VTAQKLDPDELELIHGDVLRQTGFWGAAGAGCLFLARNTGRLLLAHRSEGKHPPFRAVEQPGTWGTWGGAIDPGESPVEAVCREAAEEAGREILPEDVTELFVFRKGSFSYANFLVTVPEEFDPVLTWETQGSRWCDLGNWPEPLHFGVTAILADADAVRILNDAVAACSISGTRPE
jgi:8-oxo-dGTP pyrophosphatase MutT (NUDIX family)